MNSREVVTVEMLTETEAGRLLAAFQCAQKIASIRSRRWKPGINGLLLFMVLLVLINPGLVLEKLHLPTSPPENIIGLPAIALLAFWIPMAITWRFDVTQMLEKMHELSDLTSAADFPEVLKRAATLQAQSALISQTTQINLDWLREEMAKIGSTAGSVHRATIRPLTK